MDQLYKNNIAIWYSLDTNDDNEDQELGLSERETDLHINFWQLKDNNFLDIGLKISPKVTDVHLYLHAQKDSFEIEDLGALLHQHEEVRYAVFNEIINLKSCPKGIKGLNLLSKNNTSVQDCFNEECQVNDKKVENNSDSFCVVDIFDFNIEQCKEGSIIHIKLKELKKCDIKTIKKYIRFRISGDFIDNIMAKENIGKTHLSYYTKQINLLDLRINNIRSLPDIIVHKMHNHLPALKVIQCFFMAESTYDLNTTMKTINSARLFEKEVWEEYLPAIKTINKKTEIIAYQWKYSGETKNDFILFLKISHSNRFMFATFILFIIYNLFLLIKNFL